MLIVFEASNSILENLLVTKKEKHSSNAKRGEAFDYSL